LSENSDTPETSKKRNPSKDVSTETANRSQGESETKENLQCKLHAKLDKNGNVQVVSMDENCLRILEELPAVRRQFWKRRLTPELRRKTEHAGEPKDIDEVEESKDGRDTT
jgi:hypothetical protein